MTIKRFKDIVGTNLNEVATTQAVCTHRHEDDVENGGSWIAFKREDYRK